MVCMFKKMILATLASLFTTLGMMLIYKSIQQPRRLNFKKIEFEENINTSLPKFQKALTSIKTIDPRSIKQLPSNLIFLLERENCRIPILETSKNLHGWIQGHFANKDQLDFAALCLTPDNEMTIKIAWGGDVRPCSVSLGYGVLKKYILPTGLDDFSFSRILMKAPPKRLDYFAYHNNIQRPHEGQDGIEDFILGKGSIVYYCSNNKWISLFTR